MSWFLKSFIAVSVLLNLLLAGVIIGHAGRYLTGRHDHRALHDIAMALPHDKRQNFEEAMQRFEQDTGEMREQMSDERKKAAGILKAEPFDKAAYMAQMQKLQQIRDQLMQRMTETIAKLAEQDTPEERAVLSDMMRHPPRRHDDD